MQVEYLHLDPFLGPEDAGSMQQIAESFGSFGTYADEATSEGLGEAFPQRFDVGLYYAERGAFTFYPSGAHGPREAVRSRHNSAILIDTDRVFHGAERVSQALPDLPHIDGDTRLHYLGSEQWQLQQGDRSVTDCYGSIPSIFSPSSRRFPTVIVGSIPHGSKMAS